MSLAFRFVNGDRQFISCPEFELGRPHPDHIFVEKNRIRSSDVSGGQGKGEVTTFYPSYHGCGLLAHRFDLYPLMYGSEALERGR